MVLSLLRTTDYGLRTPRRFLGPHTLGDGPAVLDAWTAVAAGSSAALGGAEVEAQEDVAQLDAVAVVEVACAGDRLVVDARLFRRRGVVHEDEAVVALPPDEGVLLLDLHVAEEGNVGLLIAAEAGTGLEQRVLAAL